jgi:hypothetical protein
MIVTMSMPSTRSTASMSVPRMSAMNMNKNKNAMDGPNTYGMVSAARTSRRA